MSSLESIVPALELCKRIPAMEFTDTALVWETYYSKHRIKPVVIDRKTFGYTPYKFVENVYPAPTLSEILKSLPKYDKHENKLRICPFGLNDDLGIGYTYQNVYCDEKKPENAALRMWLRVKGIEIR